MNNINIVDNFFLPTEVENIKNIINSSSWSFGHVSTNENNTPFWIINLLNNNYFSVYLKNKIDEYFNKKFKLVRVYANGQTYGQNGAYHTDDQRNNAFTFCLYIDLNESNINSDSDDGYLNIIIPNEKYIVSIEPISNRGVLFPSVYYHIGTAFNRYSKALRLCVAWKFLEL